jgi:hypothetical protein
VSGGSIYQKELLKELRPKGFEPIGFRNGVMVLEHPLGFRIDLHATPSDYRQQKNKIAEADRMIKRMTEVNEQFLLWLYHKWQIAPGESQLCELSITAEVREFLNAHRKQYHNASINAIVHHARAKSGFENTTPERAGKSKRIWKISRPPQPQVAEPYTEVPEPLHPQMVVEATKQEPEPEPVTEVSEPPAEPDPIVPAATNGHHTGFSDELMEQIKSAVAGPLMVELQDKTDRIQLFQEELVRAEEQLTNEIDGLTKLRDTIRALQEVI